VGGREAIAVDTRIVAATNLNLTEALERGTFRKDLFYRLSVVQIQVPPLREREEDAVFLAQAFLLKYGEQLNARVTGLSEEAREAIRAYAWPGNVRELENRIKRAAVMAQGTTLQPADLELSAAPAAAAYLTLREARSQFEKQLIRQALARTSGNVTRAPKSWGSRDKRSTSRCTSTGSIRAKESPSCSSEVFLKNTGSLWCDDTGGVLTCRGNEASWLDKTPIPRYKSTQCVMLS